MKWITKAATETGPPNSEPGFAPAQTFLGWCYVNGTRVSKDDKLAIVLFEKAAESGYPEAKEALEKLKSK